MSNTHDSDTVELVRGEPPPPFSARVRVDVAGLSHQGLVRPNNEDHFLVVRFGRTFEALQTNLPAGAVPARTDEIGYGAAVADGIGGSAAGEVASRLAISTLVDLVLTTPDWILQADDDHFAAEMMRRAEERSRQINTALSLEARAHPALRGLGTTLTFAWSLGKDLFVAHVGDSRAYLFRREKVHQLTHDHTLAQSLADQGLIAQEEVATHRLRHVLTNSFGAETGEVRLEVQKVRLEDDDGLLLCTDGLTEMVGDETVAATLARGETSAQACQELVDHALQAGGKDNVTVVVARYRFPETR